MTTVNNLPACSVNPLMNLELGGRASPVAPPTIGTITNVPPTAALLLDTLQVNEEVVGPAVVTRATVLGFLGAAAMLEIDVLIRQVQNVGDQMDFVFGGRDVSLPLGSSQTFRAHNGYRLDDFSITVPTGFAINISAQGIN